MTRQTSSFSLSVPITPIKILDQNPYRLYYSIQNRDPANYICVSSSPLVTAGVAGSVQEGQAITAGQPLSDDTDQAAVYAVADSVAGAAVVIAIQEVSEMPELEGNPRRRETLRPEEKRLLRQETRVW